MRFSKKETERSIHQELYTENFKDILSKKWEYRINREKWETNKKRERERELEKKSSAYTRRFSWKTHERILKWFLYESFSSVGKTILKTEVQIASRIIHSLTAFENVSFFLSEKLWQYHVTDTDYCIGTQQESQAAFPLIFLKVCIYQNLIERVPFCKSLNELFFF